MAVFGGLILTNAGRNLDAKITLGKKLKLKRVALGDGQLGSSENELTLTKLKNEKLSQAITGYNIAQENTAIITFQLSNKELEEGFYWREIGLIAEDPDTQAEVLYLYANARENGEYIAAGGGADLLEEYINLDITTSNATNITVVIDESLVFASHKEIEELKKIIEEQKKLIKDNTSRKVTKTIQAEEWQEYQDNDKTKYKYEVTDEKVTENHLVECRLNEDEQEKVTGRTSTKSENGKYTLIVTEKPEESITMDIAIILTTEGGEE